MSAANKRKGAEFELDILKKLRPMGYDIERLRLTGTQDEGDLVLKIGGLAYIIEAKNVAKADLGGWVREAEVEAGHYADHRGIQLPHFLVIHKRRNHSILDSYVTTPLRQWLTQVNDLPF